MIFGDLHAGEFAQQLRQQVRAVVAHVEIGVALLHAASDLAETGRLSVVLVVDDDVDDRLLDLGLAHGGAGLFAALVLYQQLENGEDVAGFAEGGWGFLLAHADDSATAFAQSACQACEVAV